MHMKVRIKILPRRYSAIHPSHDAHRPRFGSSPCSTRHLSSPVSLDLPCAHSQFYMYLPGKVHNSAGVLHFLK